MSPSTPYTSSVHSCQSVEWASATNIWREHVTTRDMLPQVAHAEWLTGSAPAPAQMGAAGIEEVWDDSCQGQTGTNLCCLHGAACATCLLANVSSNVWQRICPCFPTAPCISSCSPPKALTTNPKPSSLEHRHPRCSRLGVRWV